MTLAQLQELYAAGWDVGNHSDSSAQLTSMTLAEAKASLIDCASYLENNGMPRAARQVAYVDGQYNDTVLQAMHDTGMQSGTTITALSTHTLQALPMDNPFVIPSWDAGLVISGTGSIPGRRRRRRRGAHRRGGRQGRPHRAHLPRRLGRRHHLVGLHRQPGRPGGDLRLPQAASASRW